VRTNVRAHVIAWSKDSRYGIVNSVGMFEHHLSPFTSFPMNAIRVRRHAEMSMSKNSLHTGQPVEGPHWLK
jgi:hypothetical protein